MQKSIRINEAQVLYLAAKARAENTLSGFLYKKSSDTGKWQQRWFAIYHNMLFYYENDSCPRLSGMALLEGCYCERIVSAFVGRGRESEKQYCFAILYRKEGQRQYELRAETEAECVVWIEAILQASFSKILEQKHLLEQKYLHLLQILESERQAKWHYVQQTEELTSEVNQLKNEIKEYKTGRRVSKDAGEIAEEGDEIRKIKKVQGFFRGWLCRRRWKQIVELYIKSEHAESMRKRNSIVFRLVECEEEYVKQLSTLVTIFLRPFRMAASSKTPPITHEDVNSIFLNSETLLFLHQIFLKGLIARMENWPTLVLDLFDMLLPMLGVYQEYVRNHHYSLQVLAEYKLKSEFNQLLRRYEEKPQCEGHQLPTFLTYPMHQIMQDEVSETENIRKNLAIERMIVEGCDILLDVNQTFVRQGTLIQVQSERGRSGLGRLGSFSSKEIKYKEVVRQAFLFTNHLLLTSRTSNGRLHLAKVLKERAYIGLYCCDLIQITRSADMYYMNPFSTSFATHSHCGKIPLAECCLLEDSYSDIINFDDDSSSSYDSSLSLASQNSAASAGGLLAAPLDRDAAAISAAAGFSTTAGFSTAAGISRADYNGADFRLIMDSRSGPPVTITLVAPSAQEKAAWCSDISQCIENLHYSDIVNNSLSEFSSVTMPLSVRCPEYGNLDSISAAAAAQAEAAAATSNHSAFPTFNASSTTSINRQVSDTEDFSSSSSPPLCIRAANQRGPPTMIDFRLPLDSRHLRKPQAEKCRRVSTGGVQGEGGGCGEELSGGKGRFEGGLGVSGTRGGNGMRIGCGKTPLTICLSDTTSSHSSFRKCERDITESFNSAQSSTDLTSVQSNGSLSTSGSPLLSPPKPKLAPIASCETLSESFEQLTNSSEDSSPGSASPVASSDEGFSVPAVITITASTDSAFSSAASPLNRGPGETCYRPISPRNSTTSITFTDVSSVDEDDDAAAIDITDAPLNFRNLTIPTSFVTSSSSSETLTPSGMSSSFPGSQYLSAATSSDTLVPGSPRTPRSISPSPQCNSPRRSLVSSLWDGFKARKASAPSIRIPSNTQLDALALSPAASPKFSRANSPSRRATSPCTLSLNHVSSPAGSGSSNRSTSPVPSLRSPAASPGGIRRAPSPICYSYSSPSIIATRSKSGKLMGSSADIDLSACSFSPRSSFTSCGSGGGMGAGGEGSASKSAKVGTVVTSSRASKRRSSSAAAAAAFAAATAGTANRKDHLKCRSMLSEELRTVNCLNRKRESIIFAAAAMRVVAVLRNWVTNQPHTFEMDPDLRMNAKDLLEEIIISSNLLPNELNIARGIISSLNSEDVHNKDIELEKLLTPPEISTKDSFDTLNAIDIAAQLTYLDNKIFMAISTAELLCQAWMKPDKATRAPHVLLVSARFNDASRLVISEIVRRQNIQDRIACIEKWAAIADMCRCMNNYNGVLQICAAFVSSSVYRLRKTWEKIPKPSKQTIDRLQQLVSSEGRFKNMRDALHRCNQPCIPYLGMYLTDLTFIEEGSPNTTDDGLVNFSKMRMIGHVLREITIFQQMAYKIEHQKRVTDYLLDPTRLLEEEEMFLYSLDIEPRTTRTSVGGQS